MPISSLIVNTKEGQAKSVSEKLQKIEGISVENVQDNDLVVVTDTFNQKGDGVIWDAVKATPGVIKVDLIYHNFEDMEENHG